MHDKARIRETKLQLRRILLEEWDPIGVGDEPLAQDEYDSYLGGLYDLLSRDASDLQIVQHLNEIETVNMGGNVRPLEKLLSVAQSLKHVPL